MLVSIAGFSVALVLAVQVWKPLGYQTDNVSTRPATYALDTASPSYAQRRSSRPPRICLAPVSCQGVLFACHGGQLTLLAEFELVLPALGAELIPAFVFICLADCYGSPWLLYRRLTRFTDEQEISIGPLLSSLRAPLLGALVYGVSKGRHGRLAGK